MLAVPAVVELNVAEQVAVAPVPDRVHGLPVNVAPVGIPVWAKVTVPVGVTTVPAADVSVTVAMHVLACPVVTVVGVQDTLVLVVLGFTVTLAAALVLPL